MSAALRQAALAQAFEPAAPVQSAPALHPDGVRDVADILVAHSRINDKDAERARGLMARSGRSFAWSASKLKISNRQDIDIALAIRERSARDDQAAFMLARDLVVLRRPLGRATEQFRLLRTRLATTQAEFRLKGLVIAPAGGNVKASFVAANLAAAFAQLRRKTLVIDADLRQPTLARLFAVAPSPGLAGCLSGAAEFDDVALPAPIEGLWVAGAGESVRDPQPLLAGARLGEILERARSEFDVVIVLTAPFGTVADGQYALAIAKSALIVARKDFTRVEQLKELSTVLRQIGAEAIGSVLTR